MQYLCLRDCFVHSRYHSKGKVYDLPEGEDSKNFSPIEEISEVTEPSLEPPKTEAKPKKKKNKKKV